MNASSIWYSGSAKMTCSQRSGLMYIPAATTSNWSEFSPVISEPNSVAKGWTFSTPSSLKIRLAMAGAEPVISPSLPM